MSYTLTTLNKNRSRVLDESELKTLLNVALTHGWRPLPHRLRGGKLHMDGDLDEMEAFELAAALERGLKKKGTALSPPTMIMILESIGVLRHHGVRLTRNS